jgi:hypothetical protein
LTTDTYDPALVAAVLAAVPVVVSWIKPYIKKLHRAFIPILAVLLGSGLAALGTWLTSADLPAWLAPVAGLAAIGLREIYDQLFGKRAQTSTYSTPHRRPGTL